jgi:hypothetical protein
MPDPTNTKLISLDGGWYPNEDGTWRVCCWFSGVPSRREAQHVSQWLSKLIENHIVEVGEIVGVEPLVKQ